MADSGISLQVRATHVARLQADAHPNSKPDFPDEILRVAMVWILGQSYPPVADRPRNLPTKFRQDSSPRAIMVR